MNSVAVAILLSLVRLPASPAESSGMQEPYRTLLQQVVPQPTGVNGYEDLLMAAEVVRNKQLGIYLSWTPDSYEALLERLKDEPKGSDIEKSLWEMERPPKEDVELAKHLDGMTRLEVWREASKRYGAALEYLAKGVRKKIWDPREKFSVTSLFPEFAYMKSVAKLADIAAFVAFADGKSLQGTKYLLDSYQLGVSLESGTLISNLVGIAIESIALAGIERHLDAISRADAALIEATVPNLLAGPPRILKCLEIEQQLMMQSIADALTGKDPASDAIGASGDKEGGWSALEIQIRALSPQQRSALLQRTRSRIEQALIPERKKYSGPESGWVPPPTNQQSSDAEEEQTFRAPASPTAFVDELTDSSIYVFSQAGSAAAKSRTQLRLLGLSAAVIRFKWDTGKLPTNLVEAVKPELVKDPLSGEDFVYERQGAWGFRVYSKGVPGIGEIGLKYRRPPSTGSMSTEPPPPVH
ncbi:MAG: hypothetical protein IT203_06340 [Fimbriimonadaceae bacterium]|nr:hypothetical protein [Fimbriimonadaceae bacterium]